MCAGSSVAESLASNQMTRVRIPTGAFLKKMEENTRNFHDRNYKLLLLIPLILLVGSLVYLFIFNQNTGEWDSLKVGGIGIPNINNNEIQIDTVIVSSVMPNLVINEIFYAGSDRSSFYFYDQFVELYNASNETRPE